MNEKSFFMVYIEGKNSPTKKHSTRIEAETELIRLLQKQNECRVGYVLEAVNEYSMTYQPVINCRDLDRR